MIAEELVTIDFRADKPDLDKPYKLIGLETAHPILQTRHQVYRGSWATVVGTEMMFDGKGEWIANVHKRLVMDRVELVRKSHDTKATPKTKLLRKEDMQEENDTVPR